MKKHLLLWLTTCLMLFSVQSQAHPMAPGLWAMNEQSPGNYLVIWKTSLKPMPGISPRPVFPEQCTSDRTMSTQVEGTGQVVQWTAQCSSSLVGSEFRVEGLDGSPSGILFRLKQLDGQNHHQMLSSDNPAITIEAAPSNWQVAETYTVSGIEHLLTGLDHVLFVIMLMLLVGLGRMLIWTITLFTLGHSVTLSLAVLGYVNFPSMLVEAIIAFSILIAAAEVIRNDQRTLFRRFPWLMSGSFGLLHGMGFAGVLSEVGLPANDIPLALASFNIGIELGQLAVIAVFILTWKSILKVKADWPSYSRKIPGYIVGTLAAIWFWERVGIETLLAASQIL